MRIWATTCSLATTAPTDKKTGRNKTPGAINGGFFDYAEKEGYQYPHLVISVDNLDVSKEKVKAAGGAIVGKPMDIPGVGLYATVRDTEGNLIGMLGPKGM